MLSPGRPAPTEAVTAGTEGSHEESHRQLVRYELAIAVQTVTSASTTESTMAKRGRSVNDRAAAGGPIIRLKINNAPTTGTVIAVAMAIVTRKAISTP